MSIGRSVRRSVRRSVMLLSRRAETSRQTTYFVYTNLFELIEIEKTGFEWQCIFIETSGRTPNFQVAGPVFELHSQFQNCGPFFRVAGQFPKLQSKSRSCGPDFSVARPISRSWAQFPSSRPSYMLRYQFLSSRPN